MWALILFGGPFLLGALFAAWLARGWWSTYGLFGLGLLLTFGGFVLWAYLGAPPDYQHAHSEGRQSLGRWWDPNLAITLAAFGYVCWLVGMGVGALLRVLISQALKHERRSGRFAKPS